MNSIDLLYEALDETPDDWQARLLLADEFESLGDIYAARAARWQARKKHNCFHNCFHKDPNDLSFGRSSPCWFGLVSRERVGLDPNDLNFELEAPVAFDSQREADIWLCAFLKEKGLLDADHEIQKGEAF